MKGGGGDRHWVISVYNSVVELMHSIFKLRIAVKIKMLVQKIVDILTVKKFMLEFQIEYVLGHYFTAV